jgi:hypothetical protein
MSEQLDHSAKLRNAVGRRLVTSGEFQDSANAAHDRQPFTNPVAEFLRIPLRKRSFRVVRGRPWIHGDVCR